jgi:hypothetical protein
MMYRLLTFIADCVDPALALLAILVSVLDWRAGRRRTALAWTLATGLGVASIYAVGWADRTWSIWRRFQGDYSTHTAFATTLACSLVVARPAWRAALGGGWLSYLLLIVLMRYHTALDVAVAALIALALTVMWHLCARAWDRPPRPRG